MEEKKKVPIGWPREKALMVAIGPSGSGKTKFFEGLDPERNLIVSYQDVCEEVDKKFGKKKVPTEHDYYEAYLAKVKNALETTDKVVISDSENMKREERADLIGIAKDARRPAYAVVFQPDLDTLKKNYINKYGEAALTPEKEKEIEGFLSMMNNLGPSIESSFGSKVFTVPADGDPTKVKYAELNRDSI